MTTKSLPAALSTNPARSCWLRATSFHTVCTVAVTTSSSGEISANLKCPIVHHLAASSILEVPEAWPSPKGRFERQLVADVQGWRRWEHSHLVIHGAPEVIRLFGLHHEHQRALPMVARVFLAEMTSKQ